MEELPASLFVERRGEGYYLAGIRISLESIAYALRRGETIDEILDDFPAIPRETLEGAVAFIKAHPREVIEYLAQSERQWSEARKLNPPEIVEKLRKYREQLKLKSA